LEHARSSTPLLACASPPCRHEAFQLLPIIQLLQAAHLVCLPFVVAELHHLLVCASEVVVGGDGGDVVAAAAQLLLGTLFNMLVPVPPII